MRKEPSPVAIFDSSPPRVKLPASTRIRFDAGRSHVVGDRFLRAGAKGHHRDDRSHANRHPQSGEGGAELMAAERAQRMSRSV